MSRQSLRAVLAPIIILAGFASADANQILFNTLGAAQGWSLSSGIGGLPAVQRGLLLPAVSEVICDGSVVPAGLQAGPAGTPSTAALLVLNTEAPTIVSSGELVLQNQNDFGLLLPASIRSFQWGATGFDIQVDHAFGDGSVNRFNVHGDVMQDFHFKSVNALLGDGSVRIALEVMPQAGGFRALAALPQDIVQLTITGTVVPEPATLCLAAAACVALLRRRRA